VVNIDDILVKLAETPYTDKSFALKEYEIEGLCVMMRTILLEQPMLLELQAPIQICGDTHGQFNDLLSIFRLFGQPGDRNYLFLGDYVDRGKQSLECICLLMAHKIKHPNNFFLLRGNHEASELNKLYGFYDECKRRMSLRAWKLISDTFNCYPIAAVVGGRIFCVHGGLSPLIKHLSCLNAIKRPIEPLSNKIISDMLWSDPKPAAEGWSDNMERGISYYYGRNVVELFLTKNDFDLICRSHQVVEEGY
jgi:serine/threonine-protein phosphatase PP1 catalytic subunit